MDKIMYILILFSVGLINRLNAGSVSQIYIKDKVTPIKNSSVQIICDVTDYKYNVILYESSKANGVKLILNSCNTQKCLSPSKNGADYTVQGNTINITITNINRTIHEKYWWCQDKSIFLQIYTVPKTLRFDNEASQDQDLALNSVTLKCSTGCSYPQPSFAWYYEEDAGFKQVWSSSGSVTDKTLGCSDSEKVYTSTLSLGLYTTHPHNLNKTIKFLCGIPTFPGISQPLYSPPSVNVQFAVKVTAVTLKYGNSTPSDTLEASNGISKTLTCSTSDSRPTATIVWYIGDEEQRRSTESTSSLNFIPDKAYNGSLIYCTAFNIQNENQAVSSSKIVLHITETVFYIEGEGGQVDVTVDEYDTDVKFKCQVDSFLESNIMITFQDVVLTEQIQTKVISFTRQSVTCLHAGVYTCNGSNQNGPIQSAYVNLYVKCSPRPLKQIKFNFTSMIYTSVTLSFTTLAYPEPGPTGFVWQKESGTGWTPLRSNTDIQISSTGLQSNLTILNVSIVDYGQYRLTVTNDVGSYEQSLFLVPEGNTICNTCDTSLGNENTGLIIGITLGAIVIVLVFYGTYVSVLLKKERSKKGDTEV